MTDRLLASFALVVLLAVPVVPAEAALSGGRDGSLTKSSVGLDRSPDRSRVDRRILGSTSLQRSRRGLGYSPDRSRPNRRVLGATSLAGSTRGLSYSPARRVLGNRTRASRIGGPNVGRSLTLSRVGLDRSPTGSVQVSGSTLTRSTVGLDPGRRFLTEADGWARLDATDDAAAVRAFAEAVRFTPTEGGPRFGLAIAAAERYDDRTAIAAMRRGVRTDAEGLLRVPLTPGIRIDVRHLAEVYAGLNTVDGPFMQAALLTMAGDYRAAWDAVRRARRMGDRDFSTQALEALLHVMK